MKIALLFSIFALFTATTQAEPLRHYAHCHLCIDGDPGEPTPKLTRQECERWIDSRHDREALTQILRRSSVSQSLDSSIQCDEVSIYGAFHANKEMIRWPFLISGMAANAYHPHTVTYTGASCDIFQSVGRLSGEAEWLKRFPETKFSISGNQNEGITFYYPILGRPRESQRKSSKAIVTVENGEVGISYERCSKPKQSCTTDEKQDTAKYCTDRDGEVRQQICCRAKMSLLKSAFRFYDGVWSVPGVSCDDSFTRNFR